VSTEFQDNFFPKENYLHYPTATAGTDCYHVWTFVQSYTSVSKVVLRYILV